MSYNNKSNSNKSSNGKKPFCKVCQDAGKPENEYTSHFVRTLPDINGNTIVTCPVLNATECRYCSQLGHTTKFCPVFEKNEKRNKKANYTAVQYQKEFLPHQQQQLKISTEAHLPLLIVKTMRHKLRRRFLLWKRMIISQP